MRPDRVVLVLHRPSSADNIGAAARAMKNFGLSRLAIVAPPSWSGPARSGGAATGREDVLARARVLARRASDLLDAAEIAPDARAALAGATWVCGTTSRALEGRPRLTPRELAAEVARRSEAGPVAVLFGEERRGLSDEELELCQAACTIPTSPAYDSMNLAQAVAVLSYELSQAASAPLAAPPPAEPARHATVEALFGRLEALLSATGYLNPQNPTQILADLRRLLARAEPTQREVELLAAAVKSVERRLRAP
ncbi:RNA methyltransferase [Anaeromyxobacter paludicola]|uniref:tRNA (Cytidine/uridine-2'-O-)-methyltransferase TrmJ n=1 Tax=Anaeromyxobacter paludicola TaxID=2918171 RepID=A0ABM7X929_9BACT|nr:TrmH family RNA methyltransferase [Anaeromyxobacter paludicola]BDG08309.1 tRNA (cytidine/uridine-2'-O-)-methyltransferase TrmJ [Anaeromyxobacter paludicola]